MLFFHVFADNQLRQFASVALGNVRTCQRSIVSTSFRPKSFTIRTSTTPLLQPLYNPHIPARLGCVPNKGLTVVDWRPQPLCNPHLQASLVSAGNKRLITHLESALTDIPPATPLESALTKNRGVGMLSLTKYPTRIFILSERSESKDLASHPTKRTFPEAEINHSFYGMEECSVSGLPAQNRTL
jgi:hypothetical protein